jgi:small subunit ribosomal protein S3
LAGRLDQSEIAQTKKESWGKMPLSTIDSNIDRGTSTALTNFGKIGISVELYKGKIWQIKKKYANT